MPTVAPWAYRYVYSSIVNVPSFVTRSPGLRSILSSSAPPYYQVYHIVILETGIVSACSLLATPLFPILLPSSQAILHVYMYGFFGHSLVVRVLFMWRLYLFFFRIQFHFFGLRPAVIILWSSLDIYASIYSASHASYPKVFTSTVVSDSSSLRWTGDQQRPAS